MERILFVLLACLSFKQTFGQFNYYRIVGGMNLGMNTAFADVAKKKPAQTFSANIDYYLTPFSSIGVELQNGTLGGGDRELDPDKRFFKNNYSALSVGYKVQLAQLIDIDNRSPLYKIRGIYAGAGIGVMRNSISDGEIVRVQPGTGYVFPGTSKSINLTYPLNAGINLPVSDRWGRTRVVFNFNYQFNITSGEGLDGYDDASRGGAFHSRPDMYGVASAGLKVCFGPLGLY